MIEAPVWVISAIAAFGTCQWVRQLWVTLHSPYRHPTPRHYTGSSNGEGHCEICHEFIPGGSDDYFNRTPIMQAHLAEHHALGHCICNNPDYYGPVIRPSETL